MDPGHIYATCDIISRLSNGEDILPLMKSYIKKDPFFASRKIGFTCAASTCCPCHYHFETLKDVTPYSSTDDADDSKPAVVTYDFMEYIKKGHCPHVDQPTTSTVKSSLQTSITLLHLSAAFGDCHLLKFLAQHGASLDEPTPNVGMRPIHMCVIKNQQSVLMYLLQNSGVIDPCARSKYLPGTECDCTPLLLGIQDGTDRLVNTLLDCGVVADQEIRENYIQRLEYLCLSLDRQTPDVLSKLLKLVGGNELQGDIEEDLLSSLLNSAIVKGNVDMIRTILDYGTRFSLYSYENIFGDSTKPILSAVLGNNSEFLELLLAYGAMATRCQILLNGRRFSPLDIAKALDFAAVVDILRKSGVRVNPAASLSVTPFTIVVCLDNLCSERKRVELMEHMVKRGQSVDSTDERGNTALHVAVKMASLKGTQTYKTLLRLGADTNIRNRVGESPYIIAIRTLNLKVLEEMVLWSNPHLEQFSACGKSPLYHVTESYYYPDKRSEWVSRRQGILELLLSAGYDASQEVIAKLPFGTCDKEFRDYLLYYLCTPTKLSDLCRFSIRRAYPGRKMYDIVADIDYPEMLKEFLLMNDC